jgi:long-chain acyl-CoA synthetase
VSLAQKFEETFGKRLNNGYGSTECKLVGYNKDGPVLSVGKPVGNIKVDIVNEQGDILPEGTSGEVRIGGPLLMDGYLNNDEETRKVLHDGYYYTGDIGRLENGYLFVSGRRGDFVIVAGVVVQSGQVEEALRNHPQVKDVAVTGVHNKKLGQIVKASIVLVDEKIADKLKSTDPQKSLEAKRELQNQFKAFCNEKLSRYQRPMKWEFIGPHENLPKTLAGKTDKKAMS